MMLNRTIQKFSKNSIISQNTIKNSIKKINLLFIFFFLLISTKVFSSTEEIRIGVNAEYETLHPAISATAVARYIIYFSYRPLVFLDNENQLKPMIIKKIPNLLDKSATIITEKKVKKLITHWEFIDNLKWGDGHPITCVDLKFAWQLGANENISLPSKEDYDEIESIEWNEKTPTKCTVKYKSAKWDFALKTPSPLPQHLEEKILKAHGSEKEGYDRNSIYQKDPLQKGLWNGAYVISEIKLGSHIVFTPNEFYYGKKAKIKKIVIKIIPNSSALEANLRSKNIDMISRIGLDLDQALVLNKKITEDQLPFKMIFKEGVTYYHIDVNLDHPILKDISVRKALAYALNKKEIITSIFEGKASVAHHYTAPLDRLYTENPKVVAIYDHNIKKANQLLEQSGWQLKPDGFRYKEEKKLSLSLSLDAGSKVHQTLGTILQSQWKTIGIDTQVKPEVARFLFTEVIPKRNFDLGMYAWISFPENSQKSVLHSKTIPSEKNTWSGQNFTGFKNKKVDQLAESYETEFDPKKRKSINDNLITEYTQDIPVIPLYFRGENSVLPKNMIHFQPTGHLYFESLSAEDWELH